MFVDPLCGEIDLSPGANSEDPDTLLWSNYWLYFGWGFVGQSKMGRIGQRFSSVEGGVTYKFDVLVADRDSRWESQGWINAGHADTDGALAFAAYQDQPPPWLALPSYDDSTLSWWHAFTPKRGTLDLNVAHADVSVERFDAVELDDPRMTEVPEFRNNAQYIEGRVVQLPAAR